MEVVRFGASPIFKQLKREDHRKKTYQVRGSLDFPVEFDTSLFSLKKDLCGLIGKEGSKRSSQWDIPTF